MRNDYLPQIKSQYSYGRSGGNLKLKFQVGGSEMVTTDSTGLKVSNISVETTLRIVEFMLSFIC